MTIDDIINAYIGEKPVAAIYLGGTLIWSSEMYDGEYLYDVTNIATEFVDESQ